MLKTRSFLAAVALLALATACTSGNEALQPGFNSANLGLNDLQFSVGVATFYDGTNGLNTVETYRQPGGNKSGTLLNTPFITGPPGFLVPPACSGSVTTHCTNLAGDDAGTNAITGSLEEPPNKTTKPTTFGTTNGIFAYGIVPDNSNTSGGLVSGFDLLPFYFDADPNCTSSGCPEDDTFIGGPPEFPNFKNGTYPPGFAGFPLGFTSFFAKPVTGTYTASLTIQTSNVGTFQSKVISATLNSTTPLPPWNIGTVTFTPDGAGGATVTFTPPAGTTETVVNAIDADNGGQYTAAAGSGDSVTFPDTIGPGNPATPTFNTGDNIEIQLIGADYPLIEGAPPISTTDSPSITGSNGQADVTVGAGGVTYSIQHQAVRLQSIRSFKALMHRR